jgi:hypothetical protein
VSKLIDRLNQTTKAMFKPIGFGRSQPIPAKPKMLFLVHLAQAKEAGRLADYIKGADAVIFTEMGPGTKSLQKIIQSMSDIPWGLWLEDISDLKPMVEAGGDFVIFPVSSKLTMPEDDKTGKILQVETSLNLNEGLIRAANELPIDAVLMAGEWGESLLTWHHLMLFQRFADLLSKPLLVSIPLSLTAKELQILWETGVDGVLVTVGIGQPGEKLKELCQTMAQLTFPTRRQKKIEALVPRVSEEKSTVTETEEEEEEEE